MPEPLHISRRTEVIPKSEWNYATIKDLVEGLRTRLAAEIDQCPADDIDPEGAPLGRDDLR
jgi:hypothetical protein